MIQSPNSEANIYRIESSKGLKTFIPTKAIGKSEKIRRNNEKHKKTIRERSCDNWMNIREWEKQKTQTKKQ